MSINRSIRKLIKYSLLFTLGFYSRCSLEGEQIKSINSTYNKKLENIVYSYNLTFSDSIHDENKKYK